MSISVVSHEMDGPLANAHHYDALHTFRIGAGSRGNQGLDEPMTIRLADRSGERSRASMLINRKYDKRGFGANHGLPDAVNCISFTASTGPDSVIGTVSLTVDSEEGLQTDKTFGDELAAFRAKPGARLCELTKLAFDLKSQSLPALASLYHVIFIYGSNKYACTDLLIEVVSRHRRFYEVMLNFRTVGEPRLNRIVGETTHLMHLAVADIRRFIDLYAGQSSARSLYPHFFSNREERGIYERIVGSDTGAACFVNQVMDSIAA